MASALSSSRLRANILHLPPAIRTTVFANARSFSSTPSRKVDSKLVELTLSIPSAVLDGVHSLGLPWCAAIPATAILVRGVFGYYFGARAARQRQINRYNLSPIINARTKVCWNQYRAEEMANRQARNFDPSPGLEKLVRFVIMTRIRIRETFTVGKAFGAPVFSWRSWVNFATLIAFAEAIRVKCGTREGLLSLMMSPIELFSKPKVPAEAPTPPPVDPAEAMAERIAAARDSQQSTELSADSLPDGNGIASQFQLPSPDTHTYTNLMDPSMQLEGFSWVQDLTAPDPTWTLPLALSAFMAANALLRPSSKKEPDRVKDMQDKLKELGGDKSSDIAENQSTSRAKYAATLQYDQTKSTTNDVLQALQAAEDLRLEARQRRIQANPLLRLNGMQRFGLSLSAIFFFVSLQLPSALVLYMLSTMFTAWLQGRWLDVKYPLRKPILPCRRPIRYKIKKEYDNA